MYILSYIYYGFRTLQIFKYTKQCNMKHDIKLSITKLKFFKINNNHQCFIRMANSYKVQFEYFCNFFSNNYFSGFSNKNYELYTELVVCLKLEFTSTNFTMHRVSVIIIFPYVESFELLHKIKFFCIQAINPVLQIKDSKESMQVPVLHLDWIGCPQFKTQLL